MQLHVTLVALSGCDRAVLDDAALIETLLREMVEAARFTLFSVNVTRFHPQGVTGVAVVGESHVAIHTWPEEGRLFVDIASCTTEGAADRAVEALCARCVHTQIEREVIAYAPRAGFARR